MSRNAWWLAGVLVLSACAGSDDGRRGGRGGRGGAETTDDGPPPASDPCDEVCADRAAECQAPAELVDLACGEFCVGRWDAEVSSCLTTTDCEALIDAWFEGDDLCRGGGDPPGECVDVCDGANGLSLDAGIEVDWLQGRDCELASDVVSEARSGASPGQACVDPDDSSLEGALGCAKHACSCCGGDEEFYASACEDDRCLSASEACDLAITRSADPFYSGHLCD